MKKMWAGTACGPDADRGVSGGGVCHRTGRAGIRRDRATALRRRTAGWCTRIPGSKDRGRSTARWSIPLRSRRDPAACIPRDGATAPTAGWYQYADGSWPAGGWKCIDSRWYYFEEGGHVKTGWFQENGIWYYLNPVDDGTYGAMRTGWQIIDGKAYYFNASSEGVTGAMLANTTTPDGYQVGADGAMILQP